MANDKLTLYDLGQSYRVAISPVSNGKDLLENPQLKFQEFWKELSHDSLDGETVTYPGAPYEFGNLKWRLGDPAPAFGQHTAEILEELGYNGSEIEALANEEVVYARD